MSIPVYLPPPPLLINFDVIIDKSCLIEAKGTFSGFYHFFLF